MLGGRPFLRAAYQENGKWIARAESVRYTRELFINEYQETPGSASTQFVANPDIPLGLHAFPWKKAFSPIIRLSAIDIYSRQGSAGAIDARLDTLAWGDADGAHVAAPVIEIDHLQHVFEHGRWIFVECEMTEDFYRAPGSAALISRLAAQAERGSEELTLRPRVPLFLQEEPLEFNLSLNRTQAGAHLRLMVAVIPEDSPASKTETTFDDVQPGEINLPPVATRGFHHVEAKFYEGKNLVRVYHSGFWIRDEQYLRSGSKLSVNADYFELNGRTLPVVGTTYMSSEVQRLFFTEPNAYAWDRDMKQISAAGLNMIRTGWWTDWPGVVNERAEVTADGLRTLEAFLMTARRHGLPVQFTFFAFLPDVLGGTNAYLDPAAIERQRTMVLSVVRRFKDVPFLAYDLINEPSFSQYTWRTRPNGDRFEAAAWNRWLDHRYTDPGKLAEAWNLPTLPEGPQKPLPEESEFQIRGEYTGHNGLKLYDFYLFAQDTFTGWVDGLKRSIRETGSEQLVTVGQDDGGIAERLNPAFFGDKLDFTTNHTWWLNNELLWCSLIAKQPGRPMLVQETGLQRELTLDERARRSDSNEAALFERKVATSFISGAGAIEWLWNLNVYMSEDNEVPIGSVRADGTLKEEARVLSNVAHFVSLTRDNFKTPQKPEIAIVTSQAFQYSVLNGFANLAQQRAVRALAYGARLPAYMVPENQLAKLGNPKLAILPSPQAISDAGWKELMTYVNSGGTLLITGPVGRDAHWHNSTRTASLLPDAEVLPLTFSEYQLNIAGSAQSFHYGLQAQNVLEWQHFAGGSSFETLTVGQGRILWASVPIELSDDLDAIARVYSAAASIAHVTSPFVLQKPLGSGVLVYPQTFAESILYVISSESAVEETVSLRDNTTGKSFNLRVAPQRAAMVFLRKSDGKLIAKYGGQ